MLSTQTDAIRQAADIATVMTSYGVHLRRAGTRLVACCPFHTETQPSLSVSPAKQLWKCFGCGAGGDIFTFIELIEHVDFRCALRIAARHAGFTIVDDRPTPEDAADLSRARELAAEAEYFAVLERNTLGIRHNEMTPSRIMAAYLARIAADPGYRQYIRGRQLADIGLAALLVEILSRADPVNSGCPFCGCIFPRSTGCYSTRESESAPVGWCCSPACAAAYLPRFIPVSLYNPPETTS